MGTFTDPRDGKTYKTVTIGKQTWLAENLNFDASGSKCYDNNPANGQKYGRLYDWETAKIACPSGWHLPSDAEWQELVNFAGGDKIAGNKLKADGTNEYGFSALPGGHSDLASGNFQFAGRYYYWWSASEHPKSNKHAYYCSMNDVHANFNWNYAGKICLFSVRCIQN